MISTLYRNWGTIDEWMNILIIFQEPFPTSRVNFTPSVYGVGVIPSVWTNLLISMEMSAGEFTPRLTWKFWTLVFSSFFFYRKKGIYLKGTSGMCKKKQQDKNREETDLLLTESHDSSKQQKPKRRLHERNKKIRRDQHKPTHKRPLKHSMKLNHSENFLPFMDNLVSR